MLIHFIEIKWWMYPLVLLAIDILFIAYHMYKAKFDNYEDNPDIMQLEKDIKNALSDHDATYLRDQLNDIHKNTFSNSAQL